MEYGKKELPSMESIMAKIAAGTTSDKKPFFTPGIWKVKIDNVIFVTSIKGVTFFVVNVDVLKKLDAIPGEVVPPVINWMPSIDNSLGCGDVKKFTATVLECAEDEGFQLVPRITSAENPFGGIEMMVKAFNRPKKNGDPFTAVIWARADKYTEGDFD